LPDQWSTELSLCFVGKETETKVTKFLEGRTMRLLRWCYPMLMQFRWLATSEQKPKNKFKKEARNSSAHCHRPKHSLLSKTLTLSCENDSAKRPNAKPVLVGFFNKPTHYLKQMTRSISPE